MYIDCHVHCRDGKWAYKETIAHALLVAEHSGLDAIFDMPNVPDPVINRKRVSERFNLAAAAESPVFFGVYIGLTSNEEQISEAVACYKELFPRDKTARYGVIGLKMFAGKSVGDLAIIDTEEQEFVYKILAETGYKGVLGVHCEKESEMREELWIPTRPISHSFARPESAETESIEDQIRYAKRTDYQGILHILHITTPRSVELVQQAKRDLNGRVTCGVTPHHLLLDNTIMARLSGVLWKMNPPLRDPETRAGLFEDFIQERIDILESDHAPHTWQEKTNGDKNSGYLSGIPNLASWPDFIQLLKNRGVSQGLLDKVAYYNVCNIFGVEIKRTFGDVSNQHVGEYAFDPYLHLKTLQDV